MQGLKSLIHSIILGGSLMVGMSACMPQSTLGARRATASLSGSSGASNGNGGGNGALAGTTTTVGTTTVTTKVELSHFIDPFTGTYKKKISIPKNYKGYLYLSGLNLPSLAGKLVQVRFNFGVDRQSFTYPATLTLAPGLINGINIQVLAVDMNTRPFQDTRLPYDLYDYNDYAGNASLLPVTDPTDGMLYCRGLSLADDPTFIPATPGATCALGTDKCLYAYAKVADSGFFDGQVYSTPSTPSIWESTTVLSNSLLSSMCVTDYGPHTRFSSIAGYSGPYRPINYEAWEIKEAAIAGANGLFESASSFLESGASTWYQSHLFPRAGTISLNSGKNYFGSTDRFGLRDVSTSLSTGTSNYVDGCNIRVMNYNPDLNEGIGSCNVTASIDVFYKNGATEVSVLSSKDLKLQLLRASVTNSVGQQVLASNFKVCTASTTCGINECCYNNRCWSKDLVSQCVDGISQTGYRSVGTSCTSDFQCGSLCCNNSTGLCAPHNPAATVPVMCNKVAGQACVSREFCAQENIPICKLYKNGYDLNGRLRCIVQCRTEATYGTCTAGRCVAPVPQTDTSQFDLVNCTGAIDP